MPNFLYFTDSGHGWLQVCRAQALALGFTARDFSKYSYVQDGGMLYLEEDCDMPKFLAAFEAKHGKPNIVEKYRNGESPIRRYRRNDPNV